MANFQTKLFGTASASAFLLGLVILLSGDQPVSKRLDSDKPTDLIAALAGPSDSLTTEKSTAGIQLAAFEEPVQKLGNGDNQHPANFPAKDGFLFPSHLRVPSLRAFPRKI